MGFEAQALFQIEQLALRFFCSARLAGLEPAAFPVYTRNAPPLSQRRMVLMESKFYSPSQARAGELESPDFYPARKEQDSALPLS